MENKKLTNQFLFIVIHPMPSIVKESLSLSSQTAKSSSPSKTNSTKTKSSDWGSRSHPHTLILFDVDGTLSASRKVKLMLDSLLFLHK